jgi:hypothetical protein
MPPEKSPGSSESAETIRLFIAIEVPHRDVLAALQKRLQHLDTGRAIRWTTPDNIQRNRSKTGAE